MKVISRKILTLGLSLLGGLGACAQSELDDAKLEALYGESLDQPSKKLKVYHLGHSLVGRNMPLMLQQLAGDGHDFRSQIGWGTPLKAHWEPDEVIHGFDRENDHPNFKPVEEAIASNEFDAFVLTEMVEIKDAIKYFQSAKYLTSFAERISRASPEAKIYVYESWHEVTDPEGWLSRLERDYQKYWLNQIVDKAHKSLGGGRTIHLIPVGQVMLKLFKEIEALGGVEGLSGPEDIFGKTEEGALDPIHVNEIGEYLVALVHYAVLYQQSPEGLPFELVNERGQAALAPSESAAQIMQRVTWEVVSKSYRTGIIPFKPAR